MKRGRKPLDDDDETVHVGVSLPARQYDELAKRALREAVSVPEIIRRDLEQQKKSIK